MRKWLIVLMTLMAVGAYAQRQQISYIEETKNWYYVRQEDYKSRVSIRRKMYRLEQPVESCHASYL